MNDFIDRISGFSQKRLTLLAAQLRDRVLALETREKIAIIGVGCRFPGGANSPARYWELLETRRDAITEVPPERWDVDAFYDPNPEAPGKTNTRCGGWLDQIDMFDPQFFSISPREAQSLDPQQRLLLEVTWRALENASLPAARLSGTRTGVFCGISGVDYHSLLRDGGTEQFDAYMASGVAHSMASGRLSYFLGLHGPSLSIDTACSSSLVAIHEAVSSLRAGACDTALAGGSNLILSPDTTIALSRAQMMAPDGRCKTFDARADGFVRGEGCGMLVLKRLSDAERDGDRVIAVIRGSAINQDGRSNGLTAPNGTAQEAVLRAALKDADVAAADVSFVEAHGTGTSLGDPIEVHALGAALCADREPGNRLRIGSVKSSIGHLEAAAGVASTIKVALALDHGRLPGQANLDTLNPLIQWNRYPLDPQRETESWDGDGPRIAGVSSFGFSGTNAHLILEQAPRREITASDADRPLHVLTVSAATSHALNQLKDARSADVTGSHTLADVAFSANAGRDHFSHRFALIADDGNAAHAALRAGDTNSNTFAGTVPRKVPKIAFVFTGQGAQYPGMAQSLSERHPVFRAALHRCDEILRPILKQPLLQVLHGGGDQINDTAYAQPALFAVEWALAELWQSWGIKPGAVLGHSLGEYVAACLAGVMTLEDALPLVAERGRLMAAVSEAGAMASVVASEDQIAQRLVGLDGRVSIAAVNGPQSVVVSGAQGAIDQLCTDLEADGVHVSRLRVSQAFHSPLMDPILGEFEARAAEVTFAKPTLDLVSNVTGDLASDEVASARYWRDHVRKPVLFSQGLKAASDLGCNLFLEIGPHPALMPMAQMDTDCPARDWVTSLRRESDDMTQMLSALAQLYVRGVDVDWRGFDSAWSRTAVPIAGYPFERDRYWLETPAIRPAHGTATTEFPGHRITQSMTGHRLYDMTVNAQQLGWIKDHRIHDRLVIPSPLYMSWAQQVARDTLGGPGVSLDQFVMYRPLDLTDSQDHSVQFVLAPEENGTQAFRISVEQGQDSWLPLCEGRLSGKLDTLDTVDLEQAKAACPTGHDVSDFYAKLGDLGLVFGPGFRGATQIFGGDGIALARMQRPEVLGSTTAGLSTHPALIDTSLHIIAAALSLDTLEQPYLLLSVDRIQVLADLPDQFWSLVSVDQADGVATRETFTADLQLIDDDGRVLMRFSGMNLKRVAQAGFAQSERETRVSGMIHEVVWNPEPEGVKPSIVGQTVLPVLEKLATENGLYDIYPKFQAGLDRLSTAYIISMFRTLGMDFTTNAVLTTEAVMRDLNIRPRHERLVARLLQILTEDGILAAEDGCWRVRQVPDAVDPEGVSDSLREAFPRAGPEIAITSRCGRDMGGVLTGKIDPLTLLFPEGSTAQTEKLYSDSAPSRTYNAAVGVAVAQIAETREPDRPIRILEIGAGTGSATAQILDRLGKRDIEYVFTDISPHFLTTARQRFGDRPGMVFATLDISADPATQAFAEGGFDVVVAGNVVHATPDLEQTLARISGLMAPGATLILLEGTTPQRFGDLTVGLLDGWWAYSDTERRDYALMPRDRWKVLLSDSGFDEVVAVPDDTARGSLHEQAIFVANWPGQPRVAQNWLIVGGGEVADQVSRRLIADGHRTTLTTPDEAALDAALGAGEAFDGVLHLDACTVDLTDDASLTQVMADQRRLLGGALSLIQTLARQKHAPEHLCFVTCGAQAVRPGHSANPAQATLWGFAHTVAMEHPELGCRRIDLQDGSMDVDALVHELCRQDGETQVALRDGERLRRRLHTCGPELSSGLPDFASDETALITGGLSGLGLLVAEWMVAQGARHLALMGRRPPTADADRAIARMREAGAEVMVLQGDVGVETDIRRALDQAGALPAIRSVIHAAGALDDGALLTQSWEKIETVLNAKLRGTWLLQQLLPDLANFVMFSSGASLAGSAGQANHAAANAFQDALAWKLNSEGRAALTLNWGLWGEIGAGAQGVGRGASALHEIDPQDGLAALGIVLAATADHQRPQLAILDADWSQLAHGTHANAVFFSDMAPSGHKARQAAKGPGTVVPSQALSLHDHLAQTPSGRRKAILREHVRTHVRTVLGLGAEDAIDVHEPLRQLGLDSLMAVQLRNLLSDAAGIPLPATITFDHPTTDALTAFLAEHLIDAPTDPVPDTPVQPDNDPPDADSPSTDTMSEDELAEYLARQLDRLDGDSGP